MRFASVLIFIFFIITSSISAQTEINIYLDENGEASFYGKTSENPELPEGIYLKNGKILGTTQKLTKKEGEIWFFSYYLKDSELVVILPKDSLIKNIDRGEVYIENDKLSIYNKEKIEISYSIGESSYIVYFFWFAILVLIIIFSYILYRKISKKLKSKDNFEIIKQTLNDREKLIIDKLAEVKQIKQSRLSKIIEIPKASLSRHLLQLEKKQIVKRKGEGKNKIISLK